MQEIINRPRSASIIKVGRIASTLC